MKTCCPYCGNPNMTVDVDIRITGKLQSDGKILVNTDWGNVKSLSDAANESSQDEIHGFCPECGYYSRFTWEDGFIGEEEESAKLGKP